MTDPLPSPTPLRPQTIPCPQCGAVTVYAAENPARPFCSQRCRNQDLGAWARESFRLSDAEDEIGFTPEPDARAAH